MRRLTKGAALALCSLLFFPGQACADATDDRFALLDKDQDGGISWDEFHGVNTGITRQGFDSIDAGKDGLISRDEWRAFSSTHGMEMPMGGGSEVMPPRDAVPPQAPAPAMPLVAPPQSPATPQGGAPAAPAAPQADAPAVPLVMPPSAVPAAPQPSQPPQAGVPTIPQPGSPAVPLVTPPAGK